jgi:hypothetical protein
MLRDEALYQAILDHIPHPAWQDAADPASDSSLPSQFV